MSWGLGRISAVVVYSTAGCHIFHHEASDLGGSISCSERAQIPLYSRLIPADILEVCDGGHIQRHLFMHRIPPTSVWKHGLSCAGKQ